MTGAGRALRAARLAQEHALRWVATLVFAGCAISFCVTLGDVSGSASFGQLFGALFAVVPAAWLWGRELYEVRIARERTALSAQSTGRLQLRDEDDEDAAPRVSGEQDPYASTVRPLHVADDDD